jgi:hypothetical protein
MKLMKRINYEMVCIVASAVVVIFTSFPARVISGEKILGGCPPCLDFHDHYCGTSEWGKTHNKTCPIDITRLTCYGIAQDMACRDYTTWSLCNANSACQKGNNQYCSQ